MHRAAASIVAARRAAPPAASLTAIAASSQLRGYEFWGLHTTPRFPPDQQGDEIPKMLDQIGRDKNDPEGLYLTGNGAAHSLTTELLTDRVAENRILKDKFRFNKGQNKYFLEDVIADECATVGAIYANFPKEKMWAALFKLFPNLSKPFDDATKEEFQAFYEQMIAVAHDEAAADAIAKDFVFKMWETKQIHWAYWWRISEALMDEMEAHHVATASFSGRGYGVRATRVVIERLTKISLNTMTEWNFASTDLTHTFHVDPSSHRAVHEAGYW
jgi:hypothetical protein